MQFTHRLVVIFYTSAFVRFTIVQSNILSILLLAYIALPFHVFKCESHVLRS